jgi:hypothetical protein
MARQPRRPIRPAVTPQERESQLTSLAYDLVERRLVDGTATAQETVFFLKAGSQRESLEQQRLRNENMLLATRAEKMAQDTRTEELLTDALNAFRMYSGNDPGYEVMEEDLGGY